MHEDYNDLQLLTIILWCQCNNSSTRCNLSKFSIAYTENAYCKCISFINKKIVFVYLYIGSCGNNQIYGRNQICFLPSCVFLLYLLVNIPHHEVKTVQTTTFIWSYVPQITRNFLTMKTLPKCFNQVDIILWWKDTIIPRSILSNNFAADLEKYQSESSRTSSSTSSITLFLPVFYLYDKWILLLTHR